ncbi:MAG TPA: PilZ domain-containing protein [Chromatiaceae bacterium]|nr:PilZ domain-containing protein [Chromatiaceae bacterium]
MDRRISPRVEWHGPVHFRRQEDEPFLIGFLSDISTTGAMLWLPQQLQVGDPLEVVMKSEYDPEPVHMHMSVQRKVEGERHGYHGYGCTLEIHEPWEHQ